MYIDTNILIYLFESHDLYSELVAKALVETTKSNESLVTSAITVAEFLAGTVSSSLETLRKVPGLQFVVLDEYLAEQAAILQRESNLHIGDAIHLATAVASKTGTFFTNDKHFAKIVEKHMAVKYL